MAVGYGEETSRRLLLVGSRKSRGERGERSGRDRKSEVKRRNKDIAHSENRGGAEWPDGGQKHPLGVKTRGVLAKVVGRKNGRDTCLFCARACVCVCVRTCVREWKESE